jgi:hypothetical protein
MASDLGSAIDAFANDFVDRWALSEINYLEYTAFVACKS